MPENRWFQTLSQAWTRPRRWVRQRPRLAVAGLIASVVTIGGSLWIDRHWYDWNEKRVAIVESGHLTRGAWQRPAPLRRIIERDQIKTVVTLAIIDEKIDRYNEQAKVLKELGVRWIFIPMVDSTATLEQMAEAADILSDPALQPIFFHCIAGHHRTSLAHAAYRIKHDGWTADQVWNELVQYNWTRPSTDFRDRQVIEQFAAQQKQVRSGHEAFAWPGLGEDVLRR